MHDATFGGTAKDIFFSLLATLKRISMIYVNGGKEDEWGYALVTEPVTDINTKMPITGHVMRKVVDGKFVHRQMTAEECEDFDASRSW
ncbi:hypothetical protein QWJ46_17005 [Rhizobium sp. CBN3]|uniref:hypothetical protein n=1 Tax=Rhizobium sp. CBN3 TaxID=3058045 RepID=UPI0026719A3F|nr:hypothetical protein [Rhizobium sp. CBN3]MDO3434380.1 hypothetical protein [Rhizobium sp. CBN3]